MDDSLGYAGSISGGFSLDISTADPPPPNTAPRISAKVPKVTRDSTPTVRAVVRDAQTNLQKRNIRAFVDGKRARFSYDPRTDRLVLTTKKLKPGAHRVRIAATDGQGKAAAKTFKFKVLPPKRR
jgi:hypothetical protein